MFKCSCGNRAICFFEYYGEYFCERCFVEHFKKLFFETIEREFNFVKENFKKNIERVVVGVSGGKDSCNCLMLSKEFFDEKNIEVVGVLIDEGIKGYRDKTIPFAKKVCKNLGVELIIVNVKKEIGFDVDDCAKKLGVEKACASCGIIRRYFLNKVSREIRADLIVTGHNADDESQTIIMNFFQRNLERLARLGEVSGIIKSNLFVPRVKPMRYMKEKESTIFSLLTGNYDFERVECPYVVYSLRHRVRKAMNSFKNIKNFKLNILKLYDKLKNRISERISAKGIKPCEICGEPTTIDRDICKMWLLEWEIISV